jgi:hypothetical protein
MRRSPSIVPNGSDLNAYLVVDDLGRNGRVYPETDVGTADLETVIVDLLDGQYRNLSSPSTRSNAGRKTFRRTSPKRLRRCDLRMLDVPLSIQGFVERHDGLGRQLTLRLA